MSNLSQYPHERDEVRVESAEVSVISEVIYKVTIYQASFTSAHDRPLWLLGFGSSVQDAVADLYKQLRNEFEKDQA